MTYETLLEDRNEASSNQPGTTLDTYTYPDNNIIHNSTSAEQEYAYVKDTDLPSSNSNTKVSASAPKGGITPAASEEALAEKDYNSARRSDTSSATEQMTIGHPSLPENSGLYHILEEPIQPPVYSTLEEPKDAENSQVTLNYLNCKFCTLLYTSVQFSLGLVEPFFLKNNAFAPLSRCLIPLLYHCF